MEAVAEQRIHLLVDMEAIGTVCSCVNMKTDVGRAVQSGDKIHLFTRKSVTHCLQGLTIPVLLEEKLKPEHLNTLTLY